MNRATRRLATAVMLGLALAACAATGNESRGAATPSASTSASAKETPTMPPSPRPTPPASPPGGEGPTFAPKPSSPGKPAGRTTTVTGTISLGVEAGCLMLAAGKAEYQLVGGDRNLLRPGRTVKVVGEVRSDLLTTCQQGTPLVVQKAELA